jgi:hypothetical protein
MGRRITVVLIGEDSLEANVGYLAALTGGDIFVAMDADITDVLITAIGTLRASFEQPRQIDASLDRVRVVRGNALLEAEWRPATRPVNGAPQIRAVASIAASLALPALDEERAAQLAEAEGLVTHLTSLVLVDEAGKTQEGVPANRKIALPYPSAASVPEMSAASVSNMNMYSPRTCFSIVAPPDIAPRRERRPAAYLKINSPTNSPALPGVGSKIDWDISPNQLLAGDLSALDPQDAQLIKDAAALPEVIALAKRMNVDPIVLIVALVARSQSRGNRSAARIAKAIFGGRIPQELRSLAGKLGLG